MLPRYGDKVITTSPVPPPRCTARLPLPALETDQVSLPEQLFSKPNFWIISPSGNCSPQKADD